MKPTRNLLFFFALLMVASIARGADKLVNLSQEAKSDFEWFNRLGFPDVKGCSFVRVATGYWSKSGDEPQNRYVKAFLLMNNSNSFTVLDLYLFTGTFTNTVAGKPEYERVGFNELILKDDVDALLETLDKPHINDDLRRRFGEHITEREEFFALGWACWRNGLNDEAQRLYLQASKMPSTIRQGEAEQNSNFRISLEQDIANSMMWRAVVAFGDTSLSRPQLLAQFPAIVTNYPHSEYLERAKQTAEILTKMIAEDEAHAKVAPTNLNLLPVKERVSELIFQLRDQNGRQSSQPGSCDIFDDWQGKTNTAAHQLVNIGYPAVPQLITALDDKTFTRSVGYHRNFYFSHTVLRVGDCASAILQRITGRALYQRKATEIWWGEFQKKGEKQMLIEGTEAGDENAPAQAELLLKRYPAVAADAIIKGARANDQEWTRPRLVGLLAKSDAPQVIEFLKQELQDEPMLGARIAAAYGLRRHDKARTVTAMIREWENFAGKKFYESDDLGAVVRFLANSDSPDGVAALEKNLRQHSVSQRMEVIEAVGKSGASGYGEETLKPSSATLTVIEECLVTTLEDIEEQTGTSGSLGNKSFSDPRVCDMAGYFLAERWPERYQFDLSASLKVRDRERLECQNVWRQAHNLSVLPLPPPQTNHVSRDEATKVTAIKWTPDTVKPTDVFAAQVEAFKDKFLVATNFVDLITSYGAKPAPHTAGLVLKARKDSDLTGIILSVRLLPGKPPTDGQHWKRINISQHVTLGQKNLCEAYSSGDGEGIETDSSSSSASIWTDFREAATAAITGPPETPFVISVELEFTAK